MRSSIAALAFCAVTAALVSAQVTSVYSGLEQENAAKAAAAALSSSSISARDAYLASRILELNGAQVPQVDATCKALKALVTADGTPFADVSYALRALSSLKCLKKVTDAVVAKVQAGLESENLVDVAGAVALLPVLAKHEQALTVAWPTIIDQVAEFAEEDGRFRASSAKNAAVSTANAALAYNVAATGWLALKGSPSSQRAVAIADTLKELLSDAVGSESTTLEFGGGADAGGDRLLTTALIWEGFAALKLTLGTALPASPSFDETTAFTRYFLAHAQATDVSSAAAVAIGLKAIILSGQSPLAVRLLNAVVGESSNTPVRIAVTNALGFHVGATVTVTSISKAANSAPLSTEAIQLTNSGRDHSVFDLDFASFKPQPGAYTLKVAVDSTSLLYPSIDDVSLTVRVAGEAVLTTATIAVVDTPKSSKPPTASTVATFPAAASSTLSVSGAVLQVTFDVKTGSGAPLSPHQVFVRVSGPAQAKPAVYVASVDAVGSYRVSIDTSSREALKSITQQGKYDIDVVIGDAIIQNPISWRVGSVNITPPAPLPVADEILYTKPLLHESDTTLKALPVINHEFRQPDARAPVALSSAFTLAVAAPLLLLLTGIFTHGGANLKRIPEVNFLALLGFTVSLAALLGLLVLYWLQLTMFDVLLYLVPPAIACFFFGHSVLHSLHVAGLAAAKPKKD